MIEVLANPPTGTLKRAGAACPARPLRVCYLIDDLGTGGTEHQLLSLLRHLDRGRVQPYLCILRGLGRRSQVMEPAGVPLQRLGVGALKHPSTLGKLARFVRFLRSAQIDVLHMFFFDSTLFGAVAGRLGGVSCIVQSRLNLAAAPTATRRLVRRWCTRWTTATVANSQACSQLAVQEDGATSAAVHVIRNALDQTALARIPVPALALSARPRVGLVANLRAVKDPAALIHAAAWLRGQGRTIEVAIAGEGELRADLQGLVARCQLDDQVRLLGDVPDIPGFLATLDVAVLCSLSEGSSNALLEYMAAARPIVATAVGGTLQVLEDEVQGLLVPPGQPILLARAIARVLDDRALAVRLAQAARAKARQLRSPAARAREFEDLYAGLKAHRQGGCR